MLATIKAELESAAELFLAAFDPGDPFFWAALWLVVFLWFRREARRWRDNDHDRDAALRFFAEDEVGGFYRRNLTRVLDWLDARLDPGVPPRAWPAAAVQRAWSGPLFDRMLGFAGIHPVRTVCSAVTDRRNLALWPVIRALDRYRVSRWSISGADGVGRTKRSCGSSRRAIPRPA